MDLNNSSSLEPTSIYESTTQAVDFLKHIPDSKIHLGLRYSEEKIEQLSKLFNCHVSRTLYVGHIEHVNNKPYVIFSFETRIHGVMINAQGVRPETPNDIGLSAHWREKPRSANEMEARSVLQVST